MRHALGAGIAQRLRIQRTHRCTPIQNLDAAAGGIDNQRHGVVLNVVRAHGRRFLL